MKPARSRSLTWTLAGLILAGAVGELRADSVVTLNGKTIEGLIVFEDESRVTLRTAGYGELTFRKLNLASITRSAESAPITQTKPTPASRPGGAAPRRTPAPAGQPPSGPPPSAQTPGDPFAQPGVPPSNSGAPAPSASRPVDPFAPTNVPPPATSSSAASGQPNVADPFGAPPPAAGGIPPGATRPSGDPFAAPSAAGGPGVSDPFAGSAPPPVRQPVSTPASGTDPFARTGTAPAAAQPIDGQAPADPFAAGNRAPSSGGNNYVSSTFRSDARPTPAVGPGAGTTTGGPPPGVVLIPGQDPFLKPTPAKTPASASPAGADPFARPAAEPTPTPAPTPTPSPTPTATPAEQASASAADLGLPSLGDIAAPREPPKIRTGYDGAVFDIVPATKPIQIFVADATDPVEESNEAMVRVGTRIKTLESRAQLALRGKQDTLRIPDKSEIRLAQLSPDSEQVQIDVITGSLWTEVASRSTLGDFKVVTPDLTAGVKGTRFRVDVLPNQGTLVSVDEGLVEVISKNAPVSKLVGQFEAVIVSVNGQLSETIKLDPAKSQEEWAQWADESAALVTGGMTVGGDAIRPLFDQIAADNARWTAEMEEANRTIAENKYLGQMDSIASAFMAYARDTGVVPEDDQAWNVLKENRGNVAGWSGPYIEGPIPPADPWNNVLVYRKRISQSGNINAIIYTRWRDGVDSGGAGEGDRFVLVPYYTLDAFKVNPTP